MVATAFGVRVSSAPLSGRGNRPTPNPSQEGNRTAGAQTAVPLLGEVRGGFMVPMRGSEVVAVSQEWGSGTGVSPVRTETHRRDVCATTAAPVQGFKARNSFSANSHPDPIPLGGGEGTAMCAQIGRASCRERVYVLV